MYNLPSAILLLATFTYTRLALAGVVNSDYFALPLKAAAAFTVHNGDVLNVTWFSTLDQAILYLWCGSKQMGRYPGLSGNGQMVFTVNTSWTSPCHWQYALQSDESTFFDSGWVDVTNEKATPVVTWQPSAPGTACGIQKETGAALSTTVFVTTTAAAETGSAATSEGEKREADRPTLSTGASIGVGFAIGMAVAGATALAWACMRRRMAGRGGEGEKVKPPLQESGARLVHELHCSYPRAEVDAGWDARRVVELPSGRCS